MRIIDGNDFMDMLLNSKSNCLSCNEEMTFESSSQLAKSHGIKDNVVMCKNCHHIFEVNLIPGRMTLAKDVTEKYPQINTKE